MTTRTELLELINNGENSGVEFKRDDIDNRALAKELVAFSNLSGGPRRLAECGATTHDRSMKAGHLENPG